MDPVHLFKKIESKKERFMNMFKKITLIALSTVCVHANYRLQPQAWVQYPVHPIAQKCNKVAIKIQEYMTEQGIFLMKFPDLNNDDTFQFDSETEYPPMIYILPSWLVLQRLQEGSLANIVFVQ
jgi:hypothetical protein